MEFSTKLDSKSAYVKKLGDYLQALEWVKDAYVIKKEFYGTQNEKTVKIIERIAELEKLINASLNNHLKSSK